MSSGRPRGGPSGMRRGVHGAVVLLLGAMMATLWVALGPGTPARAQTDQPVFTRYDETLSLDAQGVATVVIDATFDTGNGSSAGPALSFPRRVEVPPAQGRPRFRQLTNTITDVTSPSGAPTGVRHTSTVDTDLFRIGDQTNQIRGVQHYRVSLQIDGLVTPTDSGDELAWEAVDAVDTLARNEASFTIEAPGAATSSRCATDLQPAGSCPITSNDSGVSASVRDLAAADAVRINVTYPSGTFTDVSEDYTVHRTLADRFPLTAVDIIGGLAFGLIGLIGSVGYALTQGRDRRWDSSHAGDRKPPPDTRVVTGRRRRVPLRTEPPEQTLPGEVGFLLETHTETDQITATLIDLAVRGFLTVRREDDSSWTFRRTPTDASTLATYERTVLKRLFPKVKGRIRVTSSTGEASRAKGSFTTTREAIARRVGALGWFRVPPDKARFRSHRFGVVICMFGLLTLIPFVGFMGLGLWSAGIILAGICVLAIMPFTPSRTPQGSAVLEQAEGFRQFLSDPDPELIDWKHSGDVFSRCLPWAVVFGVDAQWTALFQKLTDEGRYRPQLAWYESLHGSVWATQGHIEALSSLTSSFNHAVAAADRHAAAVSGLDDSE
ncbi:Hypothetical secreted protein [Propionibacterium freudenreichii]|nr:Hypothetical secreted protein [Propionibacterium freudenreichii]